MATWWAKAVVSRGPQKSVSVPEMEVPGKNGNLGP